MCKYFAFGGNKSEHWSAFKHIYFFKKFIFHASRKNGCPRCIQEWCKSFGNFRIGIVLNQRGNVVFFSGAEYFQSVIVILRVEHCDFRLIESE